MPLEDIRRLIAPRSIALIGAGAWTDAVATGNQRLGYRGELWRVHPTRTSTASAPCYRSIAELPGAPDAAFIAVPNEVAPRIAGALADRGAGGFVCFSAGFSETGGDAGKRLTRELLTQARGLPFLGPNCYGFVNFFDGAALLPDQVVGERLDRGVALICQSGTIALTLMFNERSLPIGYLITVGNQTCLACEDWIEMLCEDPRVSAFGLYLEGIKDAPRLARAAECARAAGKPIAVIKSGRTSTAARTAHSHTGALAGADSVFDAFCRRAGIARCDTLSTLCETLKLFHAGGVLAGRRVLVMGASGGDMAMTADVSRTLDLQFPPLPEACAAALGSLLGSRVTLANPLDVHTYLWFDPAALKRVFAAALHAGYDAVGFMLDCPPESKADTTSFDAVIEVFIEASCAAPARALLMASLPETLSARIRTRCLAAGVVPLQGQRESLEAISLAAGVGESWRATPRLQLRIPAASGVATPGVAAWGGLALDGTPHPQIVALSEAAAKAALASCGVPVPRGRVVGVEFAARTAAALGFPVVMKAAGAHLEHKTELGGVVLDLRTETAAQAAALRLSGLSDDILVEEMITDAVGEVIVGLIVDPQFGQVLVLGAGGIWTELLADSVSVLPPWTREAVHGALRRLALYSSLAGYRNKPPGDLEALVDAIVAIASYGAKNLDTLAELDVNPLLVRERGRGAVAVDALIRQVTR